MNELRRPHRDTLELIHADLVAERDRLRDAQRTVTSQLGPIPASTSVVLGLLAAVATGEGSVSDRVIVVGAALAFSVLITALSIRWSGGQPYRELREKAMQRQESRLGPETESDPVSWLERRIELETGLYGELVSRFNSQRRHLFVVQGLLLAEAIVVVVLAVALGALG
jgi:acid phosphatase family membrane protein YuiD